ncbi:hypothetical protein [Acetobacter nitrogenifigens]|uniref:hypothetical protein n=1 Tax=Acetobacter nitrogenifigens TaxID=285268 RepID=UPI0004258439|nr:hypothetical protein [Acetobacter nitrogenifigens]
MRRPAHRTSLNLSPLVAALLGVSLYRLAAQHGWACYWCALLAAVASCVVVWALRWIRNVSARRRHHSNGGLIPRT